MKKFLLVLLFVGIIGCSVNSSKMGSSEASDFVENIIYVQDQNTGLCFAIIASRKSFDLSSSGIGMTLVPCEKVMNRIE